ncbi:hypothetical protein BH18ACT4_BH18ACT4_01230 [soil metagenome]
MAGYSGTPLSRKLGIGPGHAVALLGAPDGLNDALGELPEGVTVRTQARGRADVVVAFHTERGELQRRVPALLRLLDVDGGLWVAWPKKASRVPTDISEDTVREVFCPRGLVDNKVCAIDEVWSALRMVWRRERRPELRARQGG